MKKSNLTSVDYSYINASNREFNDYIKEGHKLRYMRLIGIKLGLPDYDTVVGMSGEEFEDLKKSILRDKNIDSLL